MTQRQASMNAEDAAQKTAMALDVDTKPAATVSPRVGF